jgi:hypothetical protein
MKMRYSVTLYGGTFIDVRLDTPFILRSSATSNRIVGLTPQGVVVMESPRWVYYDILERLLPLVQDGVNGIELSRNRRRISMRLGANANIPTVVGIVEDILTRYHFTPCRTSIWGTWWYARWWSQLIEALTS